MIDYPTSVVGIGGGTRHARSAAARPGQGQDGLSQRQLKFRGQDALTMQQAAHRTPAGAAMPAPFPLKRPS